MVKPVIYPPGPKAWWPGGSYIAMHRDPLRFLTTQLRPCGDIAHMQIGSRHDYLLNHPDYIKEVLLAGDVVARSTPGPVKSLLGKGLLTSQGDFHRCQRRLLQPAFHRERVGESAGVMAEYAARATGRWQDGQMLDSKQEMLRLTMTIVVKALFDSDLERQDGDLGHALDAVIESTHVRTWPIVEELLSRLPLSRRRRYNKALARLDDTIYRLITERKTRAIEGRDFLSMLLELQQSGEAAGALSNQQVRDEVMTVFMAGHETTAAALTWTWYLLSEHPDAEAAMHAEFDRVLGGRLPTFEDLPALCHTRMVLSEAMRLYPPVWMMCRRPLRDVEVGGYLIPALSHVYISPWLMQRDSRYFPDPERFDPQRWTPEAAATRPKFSYFPFGGGDRQCIGEGFAWMELLLVVATIAQRWRLRLAPGQRVEIEPLITLRPKHGMRMTVHKR